MNFIRESKMLFNAEVSRKGRCILTKSMAMGKNRFSFSIHDTRSLTNIRIVSVYGDYQYMVKIAIFLIFIIRIGNLLINSLYGAMETFATWFEMAFKRCVLEVTFRVNGLDLTYANIWQTSFTDVDIKQWLRRFPEERYAANMIANWHAIE